ncbi:hypothetical protein P7K49_008442, partial [Saguinus oedipus]
QEQLWALEQDNCSLATLVCKVRSLGHWRLAVQQAQLSRSEKVCSGGGGRDSLQGGWPQASMAAAAMVSLQPWVAL